MLHGAAPLGARRALLADDHCAHPIEAVVARGIARARVLAGAAVLRVGGRVHAADAAAGQAGPAEALPTETGLGALAELLTSPAVIGIPFEVAAQAPPAAVGAGEALAGALPTLLQGVARSIALAAVLRVGLEIHAPIIALLGARGAQAPGIGALPAVRSRHDHLGARASTGKDQDRVQAEKQVAGPRRG